MVIKFASKLYFAVPEAGRPYIQRFQYASPGVIEISAASAALIMISGCVRSWLKTVGDGFQIYKEIDDYFYRRRLRRIPRNFDLDQLTPADIDKARELCFEMGRSLGIAAPTIERVLSLTGNPISGLKLFAQMAHETQRLANLDRSGKAGISHAKIMREGGRLRTEVISLLTQSRAYRCQQPTVSYPG